MQGPASNVVPIRKGEPVMVGIPLPLLAAAEWLVDNGWPDDWIVGDDPPPVPLMMALVAVYADRQGMTHDGAADVLLERHRAAGVAWADMDTGWHPSR